MILVKCQGGIPYETIIPVISTAIIAVIGYVVQILILWMNERKEVKFKQIEAYADFYLQLALALGNLMLIHKDYCDREKRISWKKYGRLMISMINSEKIKEKDRDMIEEVKKIIGEIDALFKKETNSYYPLGRRTHKKCIKLFLYADCIQKMINNRFSEANIEMSKRKNVLPNIEKLQKKIIAGV